jgi:hypothetical protein
MKHAFDWFLAHTTAGWIFLAYTSLFGVEWVFGRKQRATWRNVFHNYAYVLTVLLILIFIREWGAQTAASIAKAFGGPYIDLTFPAGQHGAIVGYFASNAQTVINMVLGPWLVGAVAIFNLGLLK